MKAIVSMKFIVIDIKRAISLALALFLVIPLFTFYTPSADALGTVWVKEFYTDKFGDKTSKYYLTNKSQFKGTYNSDSITKGKLGAKLIFERNGEYLSAYITLFLKGKEQVKNGTPSAVNYDISVKRSDSSQFETAGRMVAGDDKIKIDKPLDLADSIIAGDIDIYVEVQHNANNNYLIKVNSGNYKDIYNQEIFVPYQEEKYQEAEALLTAGDYDAAATVFESLGNYKDSAARADEAIETQYAEAYAAAEALLTAGDYDAAADAFKALGEYKDSAWRVKEVYEVKTADAYAQAEALLTAGDYDAAYLAFSQIKGYKDVDTLLKSDKNLIASAAKEAKQEPYRTVGNIVSFGTYEQDNSTSNGKEDIEWIILETKGNQSLLISRYALDCQQYNTEYESVTWESCSLRSWLNNTFLNAAFSSEERKAILKTSVDNSKSQGNSSWSTKGGNDTTDQIFLLSYSEVRKHFSSDTERTCKSTAYANAQGAQTNEHGNCWWLLRSPGRYQSNAANVGRSGCLGDSDYVTFIYAAVRPAFWINLDSDIF